ncbi:peptidase U32 family protein [Sporosarcina sp. YIM B06819]|uniref:peptidase U32 family protein n=1 Tax=Sporosarcina sp. YIM B06819 TaxID=3081769 RepID=UPI00298D0F7D|nr:peptidase U32 family protein [Sporosarcina sp. YIM B06819]
MIELIATAESVEQGKSLLSVGIDTLYIGEDEFGLRLPSSFSREEIEEMTCFAHQQHKRICVAVNALMHNDRIEKIIPYLMFLQSIGVDAMTVGDPGVIHLLKKHCIDVPFIYDAQTMVTSARQVNFWAQRGAVGAVVARELPYAELASIAQQVIVPVEVLVYGATCIQQSKRSLVENYFSFTHQDGQQQPLFISEPKKDNTHYSIYEDCNGTHIFATNDVNLLPLLDKLVATGLTQWKLDGIFTKGQPFVDIASLFVEARRAFAEQRWTEEVREQLNNRLLALHPHERSVDEGFFLKEPNDVK